jgi:glycosyltransferase involved in cell wall biosynthesis
MRVLALVFYFPPISGGGSVVPFEILNTLAEIGHDVTVLTPNLEWKDRTYEPDMNSRLKVIRVETPLKNMIKIAARLCYFNLRKKGEEIGKREKFDFIFTIFHPFHLVPNAAVSCSKVLGIPAIVKIDDAIYERSHGFKTIQRRIEKILNTRSLKNATKLLVSNEGTKELVSNFYGIPKNKMSIVPNGIDLSSFEKNNNDRKKNIVFSGAMYYHRGLDILLGAVQEIVKKIPEARFILIGDGQEMQKLKNSVIEKNLSSNVEFKGWIPKNEIPYNLMESCIGIGPLRATEVTKNALPIKVLEYMASSLPIIAAEETLQEDILKDGQNGYFIKNSDDLAKKIIFLLQNDQLRESMGKKSRDMVSQFDWKNIANRILEEYKEVRK